MKKTLLLFLVTFSHTLFSQNTIGLLSYEPSQSYEGYNLMFPHNQSTVFLLNNCGEISHTWTDEENFRPGNIAYLLEDGRLVKGKRDRVVTDDAIWAGGGGEIVEIRDWDNKLIWSFTLNDSLRRLHHDIAPMPNGNILMVAWELKSAAEAIAAGRDPAKMAQGKLWPDYIIEVNPNTDQIVWEWHAWDHLIQDFDSTQANYGMVSDHPELIDINYDTSDGHPDWMHSNAIDYHFERDQIILSVPTFHEFWIIDHSTTTEEAAGHVGGISGKGGDLMYRWGNPAAYQQGTEADQKLFYPHDVHWIDDFLDRSFPGFEKIAVFNNRVGENYSTVNVVDAPWDMYSWRYTSQNGVFLPSTFAETLTHPDTTALYSTGLSSVQKLPNGNTLICSGRFGYSFELSPSNQIVWEYKTPFRGGLPATQGDTLSINNNLTFRLKRYPLNFPAFQNRDLSPKGWIEQLPDTSFCERLTTSIAGLMRPETLKIFPNPARSHIVIEWTDIQYADLKIFDGLGKQVADYPYCTGGRKFIDSSAWPQGIYYISVNGTMAKKILIQH